MAPRVKHKISEGDGYGRWTVLTGRETRGKNEYVECKCSCGTTKYVSKYSLVNGKSISCGCHRKEFLSDLHKTHGLSDKSIYHSYKDMIKRCHQEGATGWEHYGAKGISVCERWKESFENFAEDLLPSWFEGATIERLDPTKGYFKENVEWTTTQKQNQNTGMRSTNKTGVKGVALSSKGHYISTWTDFVTGKQKSKTFSIKKYGEELALFLATEYRLHQIELQNKAGASYTEYHIGDL